MTRHINAEGLAAIKSYEGLRLNAYRDSGGILTIGYGHTSAAGAPAVTAGMKISEAEAEKILRDDLAAFEDSVSSAVKVGLSDNQFAALVSFTFNVGEAALLKSTLLRKLNAKNYAAVPGELMKWTKVNGKTVAGLVNRRSAEAALWSKGGAVAGNMEEPKVEPKNAFLTPEGLGASGAVISGAAAFSGVQGPLAYALAFGVVVGVAIAAYYFWHRIRAANP
jgi:lysozyme